MIVFIASLASLFLFAGCSVDENSVKFTGLNNVVIESIGTTGIDATFGLGVENRLSHRLTLRKFSADIMLDDKVIGVVVMDPERKIIIPSRCVGSVDFPARLRIPRIGFAEVAKIASGKGRYQVQVRADIVFAGVVKYVYKDKFDVDPKDIIAIVREAAGGSIILGQ